MSFLSIFLKNVMYVESVAGIKCFIFSASHFCFKHYLLCEVGLKLFHIIENWFFLTVYGVKSNNEYYQIVISSFGV